MHTQLLDILVDPVTREPLQAQPSDSKEGEILQGILTAPSGVNYQIRDGVPRFVRPEEQEDTARSFGYKWGRQGAYESDHYVDMIARDEVPRWGLQSLDEFHDIFRKRSRILDAGCGSGHFASIYVNERKGGQWVGTDLSSAIDIARARLKEVPGTEFVQANLLQLPYRDESFDFVLCRGVMHHTPSTHAAFTSLVRVLQPRGEFMFLIYRRMGPIREFTDEFIRNHISKLAPDEGWAALESLTKLGKSLAELHVDVDVPEDIPYLGIPAGKHDLQSLFYYHFVKAYWNPELSFDTNQHNTFDWYHPPFAFHHTEEEIESWCHSAGMKVVFLKAMETSWAVRAIKQ